MLYHWFTVADSLPFAGELLPLFRASYKACENKNVATIFALAAAAVIDESV